MVDWCWSMYCFVLAGCIPSGDVDVVKIRSGILGTMGGPGWCFKSRLIPTADHPTDATQSSLRGVWAIYVGHPKTCFNALRGLTLAPW